MSDPIRVVIADDSVLLREGLVGCSRSPASRSSARRATPRTCCARSARTSRTSRSSTSGCRPTHTDEGLQAARKIRPTHPGTAVLVLSQYVEEAYALDLLSESTERTGYLLKDRVGDVDTFTDAVRRVAGGGSALDPEVVALLLGRRRREDPLER